MMSLCAPSLGRHQRLAHYFRRRRHHRRRVFLRSPLVIPEQLRVEFFILLLHEHIRSRLTLRAGLLFRGFISRRVELSRQFRDNRSARVDATTHPLLNLAQISRNEFILSRFKSRYFFFFFLFFVAFAFFLFLRRHFHHGNNHHLLSS